MESNDTQVSLHRNSVTMLDSPVLHLNENKKKPVFWVRGPVFNLVCSATETIQNVEILQAASSSITFKRERDQPAR